MCSCLSQQRRELDTVRFVCRPPPAIVTPVTQSVMMGGQIDSRGHLLCMYVVSYVRVRGLLRASNVEVYFQCNSLPTPKN